MIITVHMLKVIRLVKFDSADLAILLTLIFTVEWHLSLYGLFKHSSYKLSWLVLIFFGKSQMILNERSIVSPLSAAERSIFEKEETVVVVGGMI